MGHAKHDLDVSGDTLKIALCTVLPVVANQILANVTEIGDYSNVLETRELNISSSAQASGLFTCTIDDYTITADGGDLPTFQWVVVYNDSQATPAKPLIGWIDYGESFVLPDGDFIDVIFPAGALTIS